MKAKIVIGLFGASLIALVLAGCADIFYVPLRITAFSPAQAVYAPGDSPAVWVEFSAAVDRARAEQAFSLSRDAALLAGRYEWHGSRLGFLPYDDFETGHEYLLKVDMTAEDFAGNSLEREFLCRFRFGADNTRPVIVDAYPATQAADCDPYDHEVLGAALPADRYHPVTIVFSEPVDRASFLRAFSLSPNVTGRFEWSAPTTAVFTPAEPYEWQTEYKITASAEVKDLAGNALADPFTSHFFVGTDRTPPAVLSATSVIPAPGRQGAIPEAASALIENNLVPEWEADWDLAVQFSEPVTEDSADTAFSFTPAWDFRASLDPLAPGRVLLTRASSSTRFRYGQAYTMEIKEGVADAQGNRSTRPYYYHFIVTGPYTKPPAVYQVYYLDNAAQNLKPGWSGNWDWTLLQPLDVLPIGNNGTDDPPRVGVLDFYFTGADRVTLPAVAFAENFRLEYENGCISLPVYTALQVITAADAAAALPPLPDGVTLTGNQTVIRLCLKLVDTSNAGSITLKLGREFADQALDNSRLHNPLEAEWSLRLRDPD